MADKWHAHHGNGGDRPALVLIFGASVASTVARRYKRA